VQQCSWGSPIAAELRGINRGASGKRKTHRVESKQPSTAGSQAQATVKDRRAQANLPPPPLKFSWERVSSGVD